MTSVTWGESAVDPIGDPTMATTAKRSLLGRAGAAARKVVAKKAAPAEKPAAKAPTKKAAAKKTAAAKKATATKAAPKKAAPAKKAAAKRAAPAKKATATKAPAKKSAPAKKAAVTKVAPAKKATPKTAAAPATKAPARPTVRKAATRTAPTRKAAAPAALVVLEQEDPWTKAELAEVKAQLDADVKRLTIELAEVEGDLPVLMRDAGEGAGSDQADVGSATFERDQEMTIVNNARDMLLQSERALDRIARGTYGVCELCGNPIGKNRLMAFPRATLCMTCKQREERR